MERLISLAWRGFWVGLGASTVLIGQALSAPAAPAPRAEPAPTSEPMPRAPAAAHLPRT